MLSDYETAASDFEAMSGRPLLARVLRDWGNALRKIGRAAEGDDKLRRALALFEEMDLTREAHEVDAEIATPA